MNLRQLQYFSAICETQNMSRAAERMNVAQTAIGLQMRNLEEELGVTLIERHSRGVRATEAGHLFHERIRTILADLDRAAAEVRAITRRERDTLRFGLTPSMTGILGDSLFALSRAVEDRLSLQFVEGLSFTLLEALERRELAYAFAFNAPVTAGLQRRALSEETLFLVTAPDPDNHMVPVSFEEVLRSDLALLSRRDIIWTIAEQAAEYFALPFSVAFEVQSASAIKTLINRGAATTIMPLGMVADEAARGMLTLRPINNPRVVRTMYLLATEAAARNVSKAFLNDFVEPLVSTYLDRLGSYARRLDLK